MAATKSEGRTGKVPTKVITRVHGVDGEEPTETITEQPTPAGGPGAPGYVYRDDASFLAKVRAGDLETVLQDHLWHFRSVTDGVSWQMVEEEESRLRNLVEAKH